MRLLVVDVLIDVVGVQRTARLARPTSRMPRRRPTIEQVECAREYSHWLRVAADHHAIRAECLHQSLALHHWLRSEDVPSAIDIGVRLDHGRLRAHAWVRVGDDLVSDKLADVAPFTPLRGVEGTAWL